MILKTTPRFAPLVLLTDFYTPLPPFPLSLSSVVLIAECAFEAACPPTCGVQCVLA